jgi:hypothetical protein
LLTGINVTDTYFLASYHKVINQTNDLAMKQKASICRFAGMLAIQLICNAKRLGSLQNCFRSEDTDDNEDVPLVSIMEPSKSGVSDLYSPTSDKNIARSLQDANGKTHYLVK